MQPDGLRPLTERRNHSSAISALARTTRDEGVLAQWTCCLPTVASAMALNISQLAFYSKGKARLARMHVCKGYAGQEAMRNLGASAVAGLSASASFCSSWADSASP